MQHPNGLRAQGQRFNQSCVAVPNGVPADYPAALSQLSIWALFIFFITFGEVYIDIFKLNY